MICINCNNNHEAQFCPECGQPSEVTKISFKLIFKDVFYLITNMDRGFLFNLKHLTINPQKTVLDYINGKRKSIFNPITYLILSITIYLIIDSFVIIKTEGNTPDSKVYSAGYEAGKFLKEYFKYFWILSIVWLSLSTKLIFKHFSYAEHVAINAFVIGQASLAGILGLLILKINLLLNPIIYIVVTWMVYHIYRIDKKDSEMFFKALLSSILFFLQMAALVVVIGIFRS